MATPATLRRDHTPNGSGTKRRTAIQDAPGSAARMSARNRSRILIGCLVTLGSAFAVAVLYSDAGERRPVLALAQPVAAGQAIEAHDLREVMVATDGGVNTVAARDRADVIGRTASVPLAAGALLTEEQLGDTPLLDPSQAVFGAVLAEGSYPVELRAGDRVLLYELPATTETASPAEAVRATVVAVRDGQASGSISATLSVAAGDAGAMATAAGQDRLILVLAPR
jgi:predicted RecA/RadA family phage recombinase